MKIEKSFRRALALVLIPAGLALADPCGMVPPVWVGDGPPLTRVGAQRTYVFYKDGVESFTIRPGFKGKVDEFGMLIPFPTPPAIKKAPDEIFDHVAAAVDPPEVAVYLNTWRFRDFARRSAAAPSAGVPAPLDLAYDAVNVIREEAVGMYDVAVLEAGSAAALKRWMDEHGYRYPDGMDAVCQEYVESGWCFVAVKTKVGQMPGVTPRPGMRDVEPTLPDGATFQGAVQAMSFRFRTDELVVPMRLSAFNGGELDNVVYLTVSVDAVRRTRKPAAGAIRQWLQQQTQENIDDIVATAIRLGQRGET